MQRYAKAIAATLTALATWLVASLADGDINQAEWWALLGVLAAAITTYAIPNKPEPPAPPAVGPAPLQEGPVL